jgi:methylase of polypeptide subunit release factors
MKATFVEGNFENKYHTKNPISRRLISGFLKTYQNLLARIPHDQITSICEVGVGEGELLKQTLKIFPKAKYSATDLSPNEIKKARHNLNHPVVYSLIWLSVVKSSSTF